MTNKSCGDGSFDVKKKQIKVNPGICCKCSKYQGFIGCYRYTVYDNRISVSTLVVYGNISTAKMQLYNGTDLDRVDTTL